MRIARAALLAAVFVGGAVAVAYGSARAAVYERFGRLGDQMLDVLDNGAVTGARREIEVNGTKLHMAVGQTADAVKAVLDRYERHYAGADGGLGRLVRSSPAVGRLDDERHGFAVFLDAGSEDLGAEGWLQRLRIYRAGGDVGALGRIRYVYARRQGERTQVLTLWTDEAFPLGDLASKNGDAKGFDPAGVPRPPASRRLLSAREVGTPWVLAAYAVADDAGSTRAWYRSAMTGAGWSTGPEFHRAVDAMADRYVRGSGELHFAFQQTDDAGTVVQIVGRAGEGGAP
jgi:hypothetical protein